MAFHQHPAITTPFPVMVNPYGAWMRGVDPETMNPDVAVSVPAVMALDPYPSVMRWMVMMLGERRRRRNADDDLRHHNRRSETQS